MLKISEIRIGHLKQGCITDKRPEIRFALESDIPGEELEYAEILCGKWHLHTTDQLNNRYGGPMKPFTEYEVCVRAVGKSGGEAEGKASFATGRLGTPWVGQWITDMKYSFPEKVSPVPMVFCKRFVVDRQLKRAWINSTALGIYELELNGKKVGNDYFSPGFTSYENQIQYQTYDLTKQLTHENELKVTVAGGWAAGSFNYNRKSHISCDRQAFLCEIRLEYMDGTIEIIPTDTTWQVTEDGPVKMAEWYDGETYDAGFDWKESRWRNADITSARGTPRLLAQYGDPVRAFEKMKPVKWETGIPWKKAPSGEIIYDFGQNFAGVISIHIKAARKGQVIRLRHAEVLAEGELFVKSLRTAKATVTYKCREGEQDYSPRFTYMGFRYVGMKGIAPEDIEVNALVLHSAFEETGLFDCSNSLLNRLYENIRWGGRSNFMDIPTDCPQRDEREGWTGDTAVFASTACFNFDMSRFYDKWLLDMKAEQGKGGGIPMVVPRQGDVWPVMATACWGDSCILVPWAEYLARGDVALLKRQYSVMKQFLKAAEHWAGLYPSASGRKYIWSLPFQYGDWCAPGENVTQWIMKGKWVATAYLTNSCGIVAQIAGILDKAEDEAYYKKLREKVIQSYRKVFTDGKGKLKKEFQTAYVLPLHFNMTEGKETRAMAANLARLIKKNGYKLATGFTGTPYLLFALSDHGYPDMAYKVLLQEDCPGWLYEVKAGGTTIWERWDALRPDGTVNIGSLVSGREGKDSDGGMVSFNHYANGAVGDWLYRRIAGIEPTGGGYRTFRVAPVPGGGLSFARGQIQTPFGILSSEWKIEHGVFTVTVKVPVSSTCMLAMPDGSKRELSSGCHTFSCDMAE